METWLRRAMAPGADAVEVLECLTRAALLEPDASQPPDHLPDPPEERSTGGRLARHAGAMLRRGARPVAALDDALVTLLFDGERRAVRGDAKGAGEAGPDHREIAERWSTYPDRLRRAGHSGALRNPRRNLQLMITRRCQLRCTYCPVVKADRDMPLSVIDRAVDLLLTAEGDSVRLDLTGGESLLRPGAVRHAAEHLRRGAEARGKRADLYMVTNGLCLDVETARWLAEYGFEIELSLDGPEAIHDRWKVPLEPGVEPYRATRRAIEAVLAAGGRHRVVMVATPETVSDLTSSFAHVAGLGVAKIDVNYAVGRRWSGAPLAAYLDAMQRIVDDHADALRAGRLRLGNLGSRSEPSVLNGEWMVDVDGSVHLMTEWALESSRPAGSAGSAVAHLDRLDRWDRLFSGRFHAYLTLLRTYAWRDPELRAVLLDNVITGREVARGLARGAGGRR